MVSQYISVYFKAVKFSFDHSGIRRIQDIYIRYSVDLVVIMDPGHCLFNPLQRQPPEEGGNHLILMKRGS